MKKFKEIEGYGMIKCDAKASTDKLKELHYIANDIIYKYNMQFAFPRNVQKAIDELTKVFIQINELGVSDSATGKKQEILKKGRELVMSLKGYIKTFQYNDDCISCVEGMCKFQLSKYLKNKETLSVENGVQLLTENILMREIVNDVEANLNKHPNVKAFMKMQGEIIDVLSKKLQEYSFSYAKSA